MPYNVVFTPEAESQLVELFHYIAAAASAEIAARYTDSIVTYCESLRTFPERGAKRDDIRPGLRTVAYKRRVMIAFAVDAAEVNIIGIFYGGQDYKTALQEDEETGGL